MKFSVEKSPLVNVIRSASTVIGRSHAPVLECVKIIAKDNSLQMWGASPTVHTFCAAKCEAAVAISGECIVNARDLLATINPCRGAHFDVTCDGSAIVLTSQGARIEIPTISQEFPASRKPDALVECEGAEAAIDFCNGFSAKTDAREYLNGVRIEGGSAVSTDSNIISIYPIGYSGDPCIIAVQDIALIAKELKAGARLFASASSWSTEREGVKMAGSTLEFTALPWGSLEHQAEHTATCDADDLLNAIEMVSAGRSHRICLDVSEHRISLKGEGFEGFHIDAETSVRCEGNLTAKAAFSLKYLRQCMRAMAGSVVKLQAEAGKPLRISLESDPLARIYVMNVKHPETQLPEAA